MHWLPLFVHRLPYFYLVHWLPRLFNFSFSILVASLGSLVVPLCVSAAPFGVSIIHLDASVAAPGSVVAPLGVSFALLASLVAPLGASFGPHDI